MNVERMQIYMPMLPMRRRYSVRLYTAVRAVTFCFRVIYLLIEHSSSVRHRGHFYACSLLVPGYFVNSLLVLKTDVISEGSGEPVGLRNLARVSLLTNIMFEVNEDSDQIKF